MATNKSSHSEGQVIVLRVLLCLHNDGANPLLILPSAKPARPLSFFVSLLDQSGFEEDEDEEDDVDDRAWKRHGVGEEVSCCFSPTSVGVINLNTTKHVASRVRK